ncbi:EAL domain-containing protein [Clostridium grantii]|uniref:EAL domain, c-di-GMP-specific phosphodiesterase class I (Or its enzymatically inactive variant) n=1 Tax=Clostridium grantii DSM 8605 TaxID=1121316 RepID=A0A1M5S4U6_9CLOT|nr:EAL domain-containing protein [Clostridium grantii]SHH32993.1 EAL domain, c-di-GMP-specific phosphodiesterase class I (or its enzymatically inactive variant) [Clostridium grantii DSM 8605]
MKNTPTKENTFDIKTLVSKKLIKTLFQPIISVSSNSVMGFEALARGLHEVTGEEIPPLLLFDEAKKENLSLELDRVCREIALKTFSYHYEKNKDLLLFINLDTSILEEVVGSNYLYESVRKNNIDPSNIVIEINESQCDDLNILEKFIKKYREYGFLIALDDIGSGFSNLNRLSVTSPDIIKIDMSLIRNIHMNYYNQEVVKSLINLSNKIGAIVIIEGVESEAEALKTLQIGGNIIQGFYFSRPDLINPLVEISIKEKVKKLRTSFRKYNMKHLNNIHTRNKEYLIIFDDISEKLVKISEDYFENELVSIVNKSQCIQCSYIIDKNGIQISKTIGINDKMKNLKHPIFNPAKKGADNSTKHYYYSTIDNNGVYQSEPYLSIATGKLCTTFSKILTAENEIDYILCVDFNVEENNNH